MKRMYSRRRGFLPLLAGVLLAVLVSAPGQGAEILIGTGSTSGVYYPAGRAICRLVNRNVEGLTCRALPTPGSIANLKDVAAGAIQIGIAQSDWQYHAASGTAPKRFGGAKFEKMRALFSLHGEPFTVVARQDSGIRSLDDLKGKRVNLGNPGSGQRATMEVVMAAKGWTEDDFALAESLPASQQSLALCHDHVQAMVYTVGHPNASVGKAVGLCDAFLIEVAGEAVDKLVAEVPYYTHAIIPGGMYEANPDDVMTFGVRATVVSSADVDSDTIHAVVEAVFENLDEMRRMHPAFGLLDPKAMVRDGLSAPLHDGAVRYFREKGLL